MPTHTALVRDAHGGTERIGVNAATRAEAEQIMRGQGLTVEAWVETGPASGGPPRSPASTRPASPPVQIIRLERDSIRRLASAIGMQLFLAILLAAILTPFIAWAFWLLIDIGLNTPNYDGSMPSPY